MLNSGEKAPYTGVLVPEDLFRDYQVSEFELSLLRDRSNQCEKAVEDIQKDHNSIGPLWFLGGFVLGAVVMAEARK